MDDDDETQSPRVAQANSIQKAKSPPKEKQYSDKYSDESDEDDDRFGMDINKLKKQDEKESKAKTKAPPVKDDGSDNYSDEAF